MSLVDLVAYSDSLYERMLSRVATDIVYWNLALFRERTCRQEGPPGEPVAWWVVSLEVRPTLVMGYGQTAWQAWLHSPLRHVEFSAVRCFRAE